MEKGIDSLKASVQRDCAEGENCFNPEGCDKQQYRYENSRCYRNIKCFHAYCDKYKWIMDRATHYAEVLGVTKEQVIKAWEGKRDYWYMNFYQDVNQPLINSDNVRVFDSIDAFRKAAQIDKGFCCPKCSGVSKDAYECTCEGCDWKAYGLFKTLGKGVDVIVRDTLQQTHIFMPMAWLNEKVALINS